MEIKSHFSSPLCLPHTELLPMRPKDVYLQNGCWHALWDRTVDHSEAPFHSCVELLLASLQGHGDPSCSAEAPPELSFGWLRVHTGMNDAKGQRQARGSKHGCTVRNKHRETRQVGELNRYGSFLPQRPLLWGELLAKKGPRSVKTLEEEEEEREKKMEQPLRVSFCSHIRINLSYISIKTFFQAAPALYKERTFLTGSKHWNHTYSSFKALMAKKKEKENIYLWTTSSTSKVKTGSIYERTAH